MATYTGKVTELSSEVFPFLAVITDDKGSVVMEIPAHTKAAGEATIADALAEMTRNGPKERLQDR